MKARFDERGQRIEEDRYHAGGKLIETTTYTYETDDHGNWTRRTTRWSTEPNNIVVNMRTFTYY